MHSREKVGVVICFGVTLTKVIDIKDFPNEFKKYAEKLGDQFKKIVVEEAVNAIPRLVEATPIDTGLAASSWDLEATKELIRIGNTAPHFPVLEFGSRPHTPPIGPLLAWAKRQLRDPSQPPNYSNQVWALAKGVQKKIQKYGQQPLYILTKEIPILIREIQKRAEKLSDLKP